MRQLISLLSTLRTWWFQRRSLRRLSWLNSAIAPIDDARAAPVDLPTA
jgi:hypothetical protein